MSVTSNPIASNDAAIFVAQGKELRYSRSALRSNSAFFARLIADGSTLDGEPIFLRNVTYTAAKAALDICALHDEKGFWEVQQHGEALRQIHRRMAPSNNSGAERRSWRDLIQTLLSLYETCLRFELYFYASICTRTLRRYLTEDTVLDILSSCVRYVSALPPSVLDSTGTMTLCSACMMCIPSHWPDEKAKQRWRQLCVQYPEIQLRWAKAAALKRSLSPHSAPQAARETDGRKQRRSVPLLSPTKDSVAEQSNLPSCSSLPRGGAVETRVVLTPPLRSDPVGIIPPLTAARLGGVSGRTFTPEPHYDVKELETSNDPGRAVLDRNQQAACKDHLRNTEMVAVAARMRIRDLGSEVATLTSSVEEIKSQYHRSSALVAESEEYLAEVRLYLEGLSNANAGLESLLQSALLMNRPASFSQPTGLYALRHTLQIAVEAAEKRKQAVDEKLLLEEVAINELQRCIAKTQDEVQALRDSSPSHDIGG